MEKFTGFWQHTEQTEDRIYKYVTSMRTIDFNLPFSNDCLILL